MSVNHEVLQESTTLTAEEIEQYLFLLPLPRIGNEIDIAGQQTEVIRNYPKAYRSLHTKDRVMDGELKTTMSDDYNPHVQYALIRLYNARVDAFRTSSTEEYQMILSGLRSTVEGNLDLFSSAVAEMKAIDKAAEAQYLELMHTAVKARADGDIDTAQAAEELLSQTSEIDVRAIRARIAIDATLND